MDELAAHCVLDKLLLGDVAVTVLVHCVPDGCLVFQEIIDIKISPIHLLLKRAKMEKKNSPFKNGLMIATWMLQLNSLVFVSLSSHNI